MKCLVIYIHGKGGNAEEANHYRPLFTGSDVIGFDYTSQNPWDAQIEFSKFFDSYSKGYVLPKRVFLRLCLFLLL